MKKLLILFMLLIAGSLYAGMSAVVHNTSGATTGEDSITVSFIVTDSIDNLSGLDSIFVAIWNPLGDSVYAAGYITTAAEIDSIDLGGNRTVWRWTEAVADIDAAGRIGTYTGILVGIDTLDGTGAEYLDNSVFFSFQLINSEYAVKLDSAGLAAISSQAVLDSIELYDTRFDSLLAALSDASINDKVWVDGSPTIRAEITEILDTIKLYDTRLDSLLAALADAAINDKVWVDGTPTVRAEITESLDSLKAQDDWVAKEASLFDPTSDSVIVDVSSAQAGLIPIHTDSIWLSLLEARDGVAGSFGDSAQGWGATAAGAGVSDADMAAIGDTMWQKLADLTPVAGSYGDSALGWGATAASGGVSDAEMAAIIDTLFNRLVSDTTTGSYLSQSIRELRLILDSINVYDARFDSLLAAVSDAAKEFYKADVSRLAYFDTLIYHGPNGLGVYIDSSAANTNTVVGTDGTAKNPVSTFVAARTIADAIGYSRYYLVGGSTFNGSGTDLSASHLNWGFIGIGHMSEMAFGAQQVTGSRFNNVNVSGVMHASGGDVLFEDCFLGHISANYTGHALRCWLLDTLVMKNATDIEFLNCASGVAGNNTPTIDLSSGSTTTNLRNYSGGIRIMSGTTLDTLSVETDGQVIISASNTSIHLTLRGNMSVTDSGTTTDLTRDAALSGEYLTDLTWDEVLNADDHNVGGSSGQRLRLLESSMIIRAETAQGPFGASNRIQFDAGASAVDGAYDPAGVTIVGGTGIGQTRIILQYDGTNKVAVVDRDWKVNPDATSEFIIFSSAGREHVNEGEAQGGTSNTITLNALASASDSVYIGQIVFIRGGTGQDQMNLVMDYNGTTKVATVKSNWKVVPDTSSSYVMYPYQTFDVILAAGEYTQIAESTYVEFTDGTNEDAFKADVSLLATAASIVEVSAQIDTLLFKGGWRNVTGSISKVAATRDTLFLLQGSDTVGYEIFWHLTGAAGDPPDSMRSHDGAP